MSRELTKPELTQTIATMPIYKIKVTHPDPDFPLMIVYDIEAPDRDRAQKVAKNKFASIYGCDLKKLETYVMFNDTRQAEDLAYYRQFGLPDEIPS